MKTALYTILALAFAAPVSVSASVYDLGDAPLTPAQQAVIASILDSDDNENTKQRRIDVIVGNTATFASESTATAAEVKFFLSLDESSNNIERRIDAVTN